MKEIQRFIENSWGRCTFSDVKAEEGSARGAARKSGWATTAWGVQGAGMGGRGEARPCGAQWILPDVAP